MSFATADFMDADAGLLSCDLQFRMFGRRRSMSGAIATVSCFEDNILIKRRLGEPGDGRILVVDGRGSLHCAVVGDMMAALGMKNGWSGLVINGAIRDAASLDAMDFCVKALGANPRRAADFAEGAVDIPVAFGGVVFRPGHFLYSDEDGIVVSANQLAR